jgi:hypothetical protein
LVVETLEVVKVVEVVEVVKVVKVVVSLFLPPCFSVKLLYNNKTYIKNIKNERNTK